MRAQASPRPVGWALVVVGVLLLSTPGRAALLTFQLDPNGPTIQSAFGTLAYEAAGGNFHSDSVPLSLTRIIPPLNGLFASGNVSIDLLVTKSGNFLSNGSGFVLTGEVDFFDPTFTTLLGSVGDSTNPVLLSGPIVDFGAAPPGPEPGGVPGLFNGLFVMQGGLLTQPVTLNDGSKVSIFSPGQVGGFLLTAEDSTSGTLGDFSSSFSSDSVKDLEGQEIVPQPATVTLGLLGAGVLLGWAVLGRRRPLAA
jgi:hypothetical protein